MKTTLILVRHGETETNVKGKLHGEKDTQTLNKTGKTQMEKTAKKLLGYSPLAIYSSNENRAVESAKIIAIFCKLPLRKIILL